MKKRFSTLLIPILAFITFMSVLACNRKDDEKVVPAPPLERQYQLTYNGKNDKAAVSFVTLNEAEVPFTFNWTDAKAKASVIHFGFATGIFDIPALVAPSDASAPGFYADANDGVAQWDQNVLTGVIFDGGAAPNVNFDALTRADIEAGVPDGGFGADDTGLLGFIQDGQIARFTQKDANGYKGYIRIQSVNVMNNPKTAVVQVKYIKK